MWDKCEKKICYVINERRQPAVLSGGGDTIDVTSFIA
jgi:hypothetical protein